LSTYNLGYNEASNAYSFVPNGAKVSVTRDVVRDAGCTRCHDVISYHGGSRVGTALCILCHTPQTTDPTTGATLDFPVLIHKIHDSSALTKDYAINGFTGLDTWGPDGVQVTFPPDGGNGSKNFITGKATVNAGVLRCETCHDQTLGAAQATAYMTNPTQNACGACHDYVNFATGANHVNLVEPDNSQCSKCHGVEGQMEFDASVKGAHIVPTESAQLPGINLTIEGIQGAAGAKPVITYTVKDNAGNPIPLSKLNRLAGVLAGPTTDYGYTSFGSDVTTPGYVSEDLTQGSCGADGTCTYTFLHAIPANATGTYTIGLEGRMVGNLNAGTTKEIDGVEYGAKNVVMNFSVDGSAVAPRRTVVNLVQDCNRCHVKLSLHGENRNQIEMCVLCHNPSENDLSQRTAPPYLGTPPQGINFALLVHRIHSGSAQASFIGRPFTVVGFGGTPVNFNNVVFPVFHNYQETETDDALNKCYVCHSNGSYQNDIPNMANLNIVHDPQGIIPNSGPIAAACMGCHNEVSTGSHALANTTSLGEACAVCHGPTSDFAPQTVHIANVEH
jgi:OmcA/MtrC family decaheme c-type cytochrome